MSKQEEKGYIKEITLRINRRTPQRSYKRLKNNLYELILKFNLK